MKHTKTFLLTAVVLLSAIILSGCSMDDVQDVLTDADIVIASDNANDASNRFAIDTYKDLASDEEGNVFFSPFSISSVLTMVYEGARENTETQMMNAMYLPEEKEQVRNDYKDLNQLLNIDKDTYDLTSANALWIQEDYEILQEYIEVIQKYYDGEAQNLDFVGEPEASRRVINKWVEVNTNGKIEDLLPQGSITEDSRLVITNAIYFLGEWVQQFNEDDTYKADFRKLDGTTIKVDMMNRTDEESIFDYNETDLVQVLRMPYSGNDISMVVLLPQEDDIQELEDKLSMIRINKWIDDLENQRVNIYFPKFEFESKYDLVPTIAELGMTDLVSFRANLSGITEKDELFVSQVVHQANVKVDESGTEAAAATGATISTTSMPVDEEPTPLFKADHPFIFLIRHEQTGNILFMGRVNDPNAE